MQTAGLQSKPMKGLSQGQLLRRDRVGEKSPGSGSRSQTFAIGSASSWLCPWQAPAPPQASAFPSEVNSDAKMLCPAGGTEGRREFQRESSCLGQGVAEEGDGSPEAAEGSDRPGQGEEIGREPLVLIYLKRHVVGTH